MTTDTLNSRLPEQTAPQLWSLGTAPKDYVITNVRAMLPTGIQDNAAVAVRDGRIAEVCDARGIRGDIDGAGLLLTPGFIDVHSDALEKERQPRATALLPWDFAMASYESKVVAAGITTIFHGAGFHRNSSHGVDRHPENALELCRAVDAQASSRVDHRVLHRFNVRSAGTALIEQRLTELNDGADHGPILLSHEDHTPGQGQYADVERFIESLVQGGEDRAEATQRVHQRIADAQRTESLRHENARWMSELAATGKARLIGHDLDTAEAVDLMIERRGVIAEFPTTLEAAERARERDLFVVAGAPNVLRGGSHSGNVAATELIGRGLVHALASDYLITGLLGAVSLLIQQGIAEPHEAFALITSGAATAAGLPDRGSLVEGMRADMALINTATAWPYVVTTFSAQPHQTQPTPMQKAP